MMPVTAKSKEPVRSHSTECIEERTQKVTKTHPNGEVEFTAMGIIKTILFGGAYEVTGIRIIPDFK